MDRIQFRRDSLAQWAKVNPVLLEGELGLVLDDPNKYKVGDGIHAWNDLPLRGFNGNVANNVGDSEDSVISQKFASSLASTFDVSSSLPAREHKYYSSAWRRVSRDASAGEYDAPSTYQIGDKCNMPDDSTYSYEALEVVTGVPPYTKATDNKYNLSEAIAALPAILRRQGIHVGFIDYNNKFQIWESINSSFTSTAGWQQSDGKHFNKKFSELDKVTALDFGKLVSLTSLIENKENTYILGKSEIMSDLTILNNTFINSSGVFETESENAQYYNTVEITLNKGFIYYFAIPAGGKAGLMSVFLIKNNLEEIIYNYGPYKPDILYDAVVGVDNYKLYICYRNNENFIVKKYKSTNLNGYTSAEGSSGYIDITGKIISPDGVYKYLVLNNIESGNILKTNAIGSGNVFVVSFYKGDISPANLIENYGYRGDNSDSNNVREYVVPKEAKVCAITYIAEKGCIYKVENSSVNYNNLVALSNTLQSVNTNLKGYINSTGFVDNPNYIASDFIQIHNEVSQIGVMATAGSNAFPIAIYDENKNLIRFCQGIDNTRKIGYSVKTDGGKYYRVCTFYSDRIQNIRNVNINIIDYTIPFIENEYGNEIHPVLFDVKGWISPTTGDINISESYKSTNKYDIPSNGNIVLFLKGSFSIAAIAFYDENDDFISAFNGDGDGSIDFVKYINRRDIPSKAKKFTLTCNSSFNGKIIFTSKSNTTLLLQQSRNYLLCKDRTSLNFTFDDGVAEDAQIKQLFDEYNLKCGFGPITPNKTHVDYYNQGFEILAHGTGSYKETSESKLRVDLPERKKLVTDLGISCYGWITPASEMQSDLQYIVNDYFEYGYTIYKGDQTEGQTISSEQKSYSLWRIHIATLKNNYQHIIDEVVKNNGVLAVYAHGYEITQGMWTLTDLQNIIEYAIGKTEILTPRESFIKLFSVRHN